MRRSPSLVRVLPAFLGFVLPYRSESAPNLILLQIYFQETRKLLTVLLPGSLVPPLGSTQSTRK